MKTREPGKILLFGIGLGAGVALVALLARKTTGNLIRVRGRKSLDYFNRQAAKLREAADETAKKATDFVGPHRDSVKTDRDAERQAYQEEKRDMPSG